MSNAAGFISEQRRNRRASVVILAGTFGLLFVVANLVALVFGAYTQAGACVTTPGSAGVTERSCTTVFRANWTALVVVAAVVLGYLVVAWFASSKAVLSVVKAKPASGPEYAELRSLVEQMSIASGLPVPRTCVVIDSAPNAFATGRSPTHATITVTTGLLSIMSRRELRGVLAHEMAHIRNRDIAVTTLAVLAVGAIAVIGDAALRVGIFGSLSSGGGDDDDGADGTGLLLVLSLAIYLIAIPAGLMLKAALSRKRESLADASAVELTREPRGLRSALEKLEADTTVVQHPSPATAHMWIESPLERNRGEGVRGSFGRLFDTHPPLAERIAQLREIEGLAPDARGPNDLPPSRSAFAPDGGSSS